MNNLVRTITVLEDGKLSAFTFNNEEIYLQPKIIVDTLDDNFVIRVRGEEGNAVNIDVTIETIDGIAFSGSFAALETALREMANKANSSSLIEISSTDTDVEQAIREIQKMYGVAVSVTEKSKSLIKYGESHQVQTTNTTLMELPSGVFNETYVNKNTIDTVSSSDATDNQIIKIEGHKVGQDLASSSLTQAAGVATMTTATAHNYTNNDWVFIDGANETEYNGIVEITVTGTNTFTFSVDSGATSPATGTITATNQSKTFVIQTVTLNGQNKVSLSTPLARATRAFVDLKDRATDNSGDVYIYEDGAVVAGVPSVGSTVHLMISALQNQSKKASTTLSSQDFFIVTSVHAHMLEKTAAFGDVKFQKRLLGGVWREVDNVSVSSSASTTHLNFKPYVIIPANSDLRLIADADSNNKKMGGTVEGYLAIII